MRKETQKEKIDRLEQQLNTNDDIIEQLNNQILKMQDNADDSFNNSVDYLQMKKQIDYLELKIKVLNDSVNHNKNMYEYELKRNDELINEIKQLKSENNIHKLTNEKKHNERGVGRHKKFTSEQIMQIKQDREQGKKIKEIAAMFNCSIGLIHKIINC